MDLNLRKEFFVQILHEEKRFTRRRLVDVSIIAVCLSVILLHWILIFFSSLFKIWVATCQVGLLVEEV
jgi:hypothetical protein